MKTKYTAHSFYLHSANCNGGTGALCEGRRAFSWTGCCSDVVHCHIDLEEGRKARGQKQIHNDDGGRGKASPITVIISVGRVLFLYVGPFVCASSQGHPQSV